MPRSAEVISLDPSALEEMLADIERVGAATGTAARAKDVVASLRQRLDAVWSRAAEVRRPRVFCAEWLDPIFCAGHWLPQMVHYAGGEERLGRPGVDSIRIPWETVREYAPEAIVMMPCGFDARGALAEAKWLTQREGWDDLPAVRSGRVYITDANAYFARPGPRLVDGVEVLARLIHPETFSTPLAPGVAYKLVSGSTDRFEPFV
jgi:iron complex transport system substrate-binding protein